MKQREWRDRVVPHPPAAVTAYRAAGFWGTATIPQELRAVAERHADRPAVRAVEGQLSYRELDERTDRVAVGLHALGLDPGDRIVFQLGNGLATVLAWYGALKAGLVPVCALIQHREHEIGAIAVLSEARAHLVQAEVPKFDLVAFGHEMGVGTLLTAGAGGRETSALRIEELGADVDAAEARALVDSIQAGIDPDDVAVFQLSGGTTSVPKIIPRLHAEYWYNASAYAHFWGWTPASRPAHLIPIIHNAGITCTLHAAHSVGACAVIGSPDAESALTLFEEERVTDVILNLTLATIVLEHPRLHAAVLASVERVVYSGSKLPAHIEEGFETESTTIVQLFGMGEGLFLVTPEDAPAEMRHETVGVPLSPLDEVRVLEPGGERELPPGAEGELCCRGPYTIPGYYAAPDRNREAFTTDGLYRTGDLAVAREIGGATCYAIEGRIKDVISRGGEKVNAEEVELLVCEHPAVAAVAIVSMPDERLGERACACVVPTPGSTVPTLAELTTFLAERGLAKFKWPERVESLGRLPVTNIGKIDKQALRAHVASLPLGPAR